MRESFSVASYNILADSYIRSEWYPRTPAALLQPGARKLPLARHVEALGADLLCLQEVEPGAYAELEGSLRPLGYGGRFLRKAAKPDGCAIFFRGFELRSQYDLRFADGPPDSGHVALMLLLGRKGAELGVATTHLKWGPPGEGPRFRQVEQLLRERPPCPTWIVCGDFNAPPEDGTVARMRAAGLLDAFAGRPGAFTCNSNGKKKRIDYLFNTSDLRARPAELPPLDDETPLPSETQPSDHLALLADFAPASEEGRGG